ncbi:MAG: thrombospondin type 3 repeat-containing protein [Myxococcales bacterium]
MVRSTLSALAAAAAFVLAARTAGATECTGTLLSTCIQSDAFWPHAGPASFLGVGAAETLVRGQLGFGLVTSYQSRPLTLKSASPGPGGSDVYVIDNQVTTNFLWSYGVTNRLQLDFAVPLTLAQDGSGVQSLSGGAPIASTALRDLRFGAAFALVPRARVSPEPRRKGSAPSVWALTARFELSAPTGERRDFAGERSVVWMPSVAADYRRGRWFAGAELGLRIRPVTELVGARVGTQGVVAFGAGYDVLPRELLSGMLEARVLPIFAEQHDVAATSSGLVSTGNGKFAVPAEWTLSARTAPLLSGDLAIHLGGGGAIPFSSDAAPTAPRFRFMLGVRYAPLGRDTDGDGILDRVDKCPFEAASGEPKDGCPHELPKPTVAPVVLGLASKVDRCTEEPDTVDGFHSDGGCPDDDADGDGIDDRHDRCPLEAEDSVGVADGCPERRESR